MATLSFSPAQVDLVLYQGDEVSFVVRLRASEAIPAVYRDLTGLQAQAQLRTAPGAPALVASFVATILDQVDPLTMGAIKLFIAGDTMNSVEQGGYAWDLELADYSGAGRKTVAAGKVTVAEQVTVSVPYVPPPPSSPVSNYAFIRQRNLADGTVEVSASWDYTGPVLSSFYFVSGSNYTAVDGIDRSAILVLPAAAAAVGAVLSLNLRSNAVGGPVLATLNHTVTAAAALTVSNFRVVSEAYDGGLDCRLYVAWDAIGSLPANWTVFHPGMPNDDYPETFNGDANVVGYWATVPVGSNVHLELRSQPDGVLHATLDYVSQPAGTVTSFVVASQSPPTQYDSFLLNLAWTVSAGAMPRTWNITQTGRATSYEDNPARGHRLYGFGAVGDTIHVVLANGITGVEMASLDHVLS